MLIAVPLYLRYHVYSEHVVPLGMSDMRLVDSKISTTWCQVRYSQNPVFLNVIFILATTGQVQCDIQCVPPHRETSNSAQAEICESGSRNCPRG